MLSTSVDRILQRLDDSDVVLDIGAWGRPFARADWVLDHMPYETRGLYGRDGEGPERFSERTWIRRDICDRELFPFGDKEIDFVICSQTLEDVRDPIGVCSEMIRIGKAGYIEIPSRLEEQSYAIQGPWVGWGHHHWLIDVTPGRIEFTFKHHIVHGKPAQQFPAGFYDELAPEERVQMLWWEGGFEYAEKTFETPEDLDHYLESFVAEELRLRGLPAAGESASNSLGRRARGWLFGR